MFFVPLTAFHLDLQLTEQSPLNNIIYKARLKPFVATNHEVSVSSQSEITFCLCKIMNFEMRETYVRLCILR